MTDDLRTPTFSWNGFGPIGNVSGLPLTPIKCLCGITAVVNTLAWGFQCQPCYDGSVAAFREETRTIVADAFEIPDALRDAWRQTDD